MFPLSLQCEIGMTTAPATEKLAAASPAPRRLRPDGRLAAADAIRCAWCHRACGILRGTYSCAPRICHAVKIRLRNFRCACPVQPLFDMARSGNTPSLVCANEKAIWQLRCHGSFVAEKHGRAIRKFDLCHVACYRIEFHVIALFGSVRPEPPGRSSSNLRTSIRWPVELQIPQNIINRRLFGRVIPVITGHLNAHDNLGPS